MTSTGIQLLKRHEALSLAPYIDTEGWLTIGYGHNLGIKPMLPPQLLREVASECITQRAALVMLEDDLINAAADALVVCDCFDRLSPARQDVLEMMAFNLGRKKLATFQRMLRALKEGDFDLAAEEMLDSKWAEQVGSRAMELSNIMRRGEYL